MCQLSLSEYWCPALETACQQITAETATHSQLTAGEKHKFVHVSFEKCDMNTFTLQHLLWELGGVSLVKRGEDNCQFLY